MLRLLHPGLGRHMSESLQCEQLPELFTGQVLATGPAQANAPGIDSGSDSDSELSIRTAGA